MDGRILTTYTSYDSLRRELPFEGCNDCIFSGIKFFNRD